MNGFVAVETKPGMEGRGGRALLQREPLVEGRLGRIGTNVVNKALKTDVEMTATQTSAEKVWVAAQQVLKTLLTPEIYNLWFAALRASSLDDDSLVLEVSNEFCELWLQDNYLSLLNDVLAQVTGQRLEVAFKVRSGDALAKGRREEAEAPSTESPAGRPAAKEAPSDDERSTLIREISFNPKNTFETFVVGSNNTFAHAAAMAVAQAPGKSYNPLFVYGGSGLGKTHLLHAIGQYVASHKKGARVAFLSSEKFTNDFIVAIQNNQLVLF